MSLPVSCQYFGDRDKVIASKMLGVVLIESLEVLCKVINHLDRESSESLEFLDLSGSYQREQVGHGRHCDWWWHHAEGRYLQKLIGGGWKGNWKGIIFLLEWEGRMRNMYRSHRKMQHRNRLFDTPSTHGPSNYFHPIFKEFHHTLINFPQIVTLGEFVAAT